MTDLVDSVTIWGDDCRQSVVPLDNVIAQSEHVKMITFDRRNASVFHRSRT